MGIFIKIAPEVLFRSSHDLTADYYSIGVIGFECCVGHVINYNIETL